jgi:hypothetical protein
MEHRISGLKPPTTFIYGENDWMDPQAGARICETLDSQGAVSQSQAAVTIPHRNKVLFIEGAGHFVFLEQPELFNNLLLEVIQHCLAKDDTVAKAQHFHEGGHGAGTEGDQGVSVETNIKAAFTEV